MVDYVLKPQIYYAGGYHDIPVDRVASPQGIQYTRGVTDEWDLQQGSLTFRCWDDDDTYRPTNPESPLYGIIGAYLPFLYSIDSVHQYAGEIADLTPGQTDDHQTTAKITTTGLRWVDFNVSGPLNTVGRLRDQIASPLYTQIKSLTTMRAYWPGEDGPDSAVMSSATSGVPAATVTGSVTFQGGDGPAGSNKLLTMGTGGRITGRFPGGLSTTGWQIQFTTDVLGADATERQIYFWTTTNGYTWVWAASTTTYNITVLDPDRVVLFNSSIGNGGVVPGENIVFRLKASWAAGTWTFEPGWYEENAPVLTGTSGTFAGTAGAPVAWTVATNSPVMQGAYFGHHFVCTGVSESLQSTQMLNAINGYPGELTSDRITRLLGGRSIPLELLGDVAKATPMGPQRPGTLKEQLQEIRSTEQGLIFESPDGRGLRFALRNYLYTQANTPALNLTYPTDIGPGLAEKATSRELYNVVTAQDRSGSSVTVTEPNGRYGTATPPAGSGPLDKQVPVNLGRIADVRQTANSHLRYYQQTGRFDTITVDLDNSPALRTAVEALDVGQFIKLSGRTPDPVLLMVIRVGARDQLKRHVKFFDVVPGDMFATGVWDGDRKADLASCTLSTGYSSTATSLVLSLTADERWSTTATPYDLMISGERVTVTAMAARAGTGPWTQTATVTRSVNGVVKAQASGAAVRIAKRGVWGW